MNEELLAAIVSYLYLSGALLVSHNGFINFFCNCKMLSQPKSAVHQQTAKLFQQHRRHIKGNYDLNSAFENTDGLRTKAYRQSVSLYCASNIIKPTCVGIYRKKYF
jgi:hypothetical protein